MIKIFVISLNRAIDRRRIIKRDFEKLGLDFEFFDAIDGVQLSEEEIGKYCDKEEILKNPKWLSRGAIGCALSHYFVYEKILKENIPAALILEDDVKLSPDFPYLLSQLKDQLFKNEVLLTYFASWEPCSLSTVEAKKVYKKYTLHFPIDVNQLISTVGYIITNDACRSLLPVLLPIRRGADCWGNFFSDKGFENIRCLYPSPIDNYDPKSTIGYINNNSLWGNVSAIIDKYKIFPIYQILIYKRKSFRKKMNKVRIVNDKPYWASPVGKNISE